jgi:hypothetical protein
MKMSKHDRDDFVDFCTCEIERTWQEVTGHSLALKTFAKIREALGDLLPIKIPLKKEKK